LSMRVDSRLRWRTPRSAISEGRSPRRDDGQTFGLLVSSDQGNPTRS